MNQTDLRRVDLNLLVLFEALMEERHVGRTAVRLGMSQSGASYALSRLRALVDDALFLPHPRGVHPTPRALAMADPVKDMLALARQTLSRDEQFAPEAVSRTFTIGATDYASFVVLPRLMPVLRQSAPGVDLRIRPVDRDSVYPDLDTGRLDVSIALAADMPDRFQATPLFQERLVCVGRTGHPLFEQPLTPNSLASTPQMLVSPRGDAIGPADEALAQLGLHRRVALTAPHFLVAPFILESCDLVALLASRIAERFSRVAALEVHEVPLRLPTWTVALVVRHDRSREPGLAWLTDLILSCVESVNLPSGHVEIARGRPSPTSLLRK